METVMRFKEQGNTAFRRDCYQDAVHAYTSALQDCDSLENVGTALLHDLHNNRALARLRLGDHAGALQDASAALSIQPRSSKALYRSAVALVGLGGSQRLNQAMQMAQKVAELEPQNKEVVTLIGQITSQLASSCAGTGADNKPTPVPDQPASLGRQVNTKTELSSSIPDEIRNGHLYLPSCDGIDENLLILLHGLGDTPKPYMELATKLSFPQTACLALPGPLAVPETNGGRAWFHAFDPDTWEPIKGVPGETRRTSSLERTRSLLMKLINGLADKGLWAPHQVSLLGFSQGAIAALDVHRQYLGTKSLAGCIAVAGTLLREHVQAEEARPASLQGVGCGPVLITRGGRDEIITASHVNMTIEHLRKYHGCSVEHLEVKGKGHSMLGPVRAEVEACMKFWARTLRAAAPAEGCVEVRP